MEEVKRGKKQEARDLNFDEEYYTSEEFQNILESYETSMNEGNAPFMDADDLVDIADYYNWQGEYDKADETVEHALSLYPDATLPNVYKARQALQNQDFEGARQYADSIVHQDDPDYHYLVAEILIAEGRIDESDRYLRDYALTVDDDEYQDFIKDCANLYVDYGYSDKAYEWMIRLKGDDSDDFKELMARTLFGLGKYQDSERLFNELIDRNPFSGLYWNALASSQYMRENYNDSITSSEYAIAIDPQDPEALLIKANSLQQLGNEKEALKYYERYTEVTDADDTQLPQIFTEMAFCYSDMEQHDKAIEMLDRISQPLVDEDEMLVLRGHLLLCADKVKEAEAAFRQAIIQSDSSPLVLLRIIVSLYDNRYLEASYKMFQKFFSIIDKLDAEFHSGYAYMALVCYDMKKTDEFMKYLRLAVEQNPQEAQAVLNSLFPENMPVNEYVKYMEGVKEDRT